MGLKRVPFHAHYEPPPPPEPGQRRLPEEIEADIRKQEQEFQKLALISVGLPSEVLWFEPPTVAGWDEKENMWSTEDFHDFKFNEEKQVLTFRMGKFGTIGLAAYRYSNLPYQSWEIKPSKSDGVIFNLTAAVMILEFVIKEDKITITQIQNGPSDALQDITGKELSLYEVKTILLQGGLDIFPGHDACYYVEGCARKHRATEGHLYHCMAQLCICYQFAWSRWNLLAGRRNIILQMREYSHKKTQLQGEYALLHVTPLKTSIAKCTEMSQTFSEEDEEDSKFYADLYHLAKSQANFAVQQKFMFTSPILVETVYSFLSQIRMLSYS